MLVLGCPEGEAFVFATPLLPYFSDASLLLLVCVARLSECAATERLSAFKETNP